MSHRSLIEATEGKDAARVGALLEGGWHVDEQNEYSETPLLIASRQGSANLCAILLKNKATVNETDGAGFTALHRASDYGHLEVVHTLLKYGANVNAVTGWEDSTPCHLAARRGYVPIVKVLVEAGADLKRRDRDGRRVVDEAGRYGHRAVIDWIKSSNRGCWLQSGIEISVPRRRKRLIIPNPAPELLLKSK